MGRAAVPPPLPRCRFRRHLLRDGVGSHRKNRAGRRQGTRRAARPAGRRRVRGGGASRLLRPRAGHDFSLRVALRGGGGSGPAEPRGGEQETRVLFGAAAGHPPPGREHRKIRRDVAGGHADSDGQTQRGRAGHGAVRTDGVLRPPALVRRPHGQCVRITVRRRRHGHHCRSPPRRDGGERGDRQGLQIRVGGCAPERALRGVHGQGVYEPRRVHRQPQQHVGGARLDQRGGTAGGLDREVWRRAAGAGRGAARLPHPRGGAVERPPQEVDLSPTEGQRAGL
mmetsp:Transcript_15527/g.30970  ORF Transcript_15527/g.30970 Transcript_15527/m.30970 type:complete len:282 (-) Transcript_15527:422-1267(-)